MCFPKNKAALFSFTNAVLTTTAFFILLSQCANPSNPSGGPKDTIPPTVLTVYPEFGSLNLNTKEFTFTFDERVTADKLKQNLVISPNYKGDYNFVTKKETFIIEFEEPFLDSTTYTLNFADGLTDITENNPAPNLVYVFSTGNFLDSLSVAGKVTNLLSQEPEKEYTVALYTFNDSLSIFEATPKYFTKTDDNGEYQINYIKNDNYKLLAFHDENRNLKLDKATESYGFLPDTLRLVSNQDSLNIQTVTINADSLKVLSSRPYSKYFEIRFNKPVSVKKIRYDSTSFDFLPFTYQDERKVLRYYNTGLTIDTDSMQIEYTVTDTLGNVLTNTAYMKFTSLTGKQEKFNLKIQPSRIPSADDTITFTVSTELPIRTIQEDSIELNYDTIFNTQPEFSYKLNQTRTKANIRIPVNWKSIQDTIRTIKQLQTDSLLNKEEEVAQLNLVLKQAFAVSINQDSSQLVTNRITKYTPADFGTIAISIQTSYTSFIVELIDKEKTIVQSIANKKDHTFTRLELGEYSLRAKIDLDNNGRWDPGNILTDTPPEPIIYYGSYTEVRPNFEIQIEDFSF